jgi:hypothetical protein
VNRKTGSRHREPPIAVTVRLKAAASRESRDRRAHDQSSVGPEKVHQVVEKRDIHLRLGKVVLAADREEPFLEVVSGGGAADRMVAQQPRRGSRAGPAGVGCGDRLEVMPVAKA